MSKKILEKLDLLGQELAVLEKKLIEKRNNSSDQNQLFNAENADLQNQLRKEQAKTKKISDILSKNIIKIERIIEKEEKNNA